MAMEFSNNETPYLGVLIDSKMESSWMGHDTINVLPTIGHGGSDGASERLNR